MAKRKSRRERFEEIQGRIAEAKEGIEELRQELEDWRDNIPENLQAAAKADELDQVIGELEDLTQSLDEVCEADIEWPRMVG